MVCYMYYTDVFVGHNKDNINKLKDALNAELGDSVLNDDLNELVHGLCLFMGYPSCLCSLKANVDKSLQDISRKLKKDSEAVQSCVSITTLNLNCSCNSKEILCKCCVISCIKELREQCNCPRLNDPSTECKCKEPKEKCCKDFLSGLEACLSLLNLKTDLAGCDCDGKTCCKTGTCINKCDLCSPSKFPDNAMTGLGICPMNPKKLAGKLEKFFGDKTSKSCSCKCNGSKSCCCLACDSAKCAQACFCLPNSKCSCASKLKLPKTPSDCPRKKFCEAIQNVKVLADSSEMTCCDGGKKCHCELQSPGSSCTPNCCVVSDKSGAGSNHYQQSVKCVIRRVVKFFASFDPSKPDCPKLCCEIFCVLKCCEFLRDFYDKGNKKCSKCKSGGSSGGKPCPGSTLTSGSPSCCNGKSGCKSGNCCLGCQDCDAIKFSRALQKLQYSGPCGLDLYRLLKDLLNFIRNVMHPNHYFIHDTVVQAVNSCNNCKKSETDSSKWKACDCSKSGSSSCQACTSLLKDSSLKSLFNPEYVSSYVNSTWESLSSTSGSGSKCCGSDPSCTCPPNCSSSGSPSCPSKCCEKCPKRLCAKIFLGMLPCLYYGLKIVFDRCDPANSELWPGWQTKITQGSIQNFFFAWGVHSYLNPSTHAVVLPVFLMDLFSSQSTGSFDKIYNFVSQKYFSKTLPPSPCSSSCPSPSPSSSHVYPSTVRSILLWLSGLPFSKGFNALIQYCSALCPPSEKSLNSDEFLYCIHVSCFFVPVSVISAIQHPGASKSFLPSTSDWTSFCYPEDPFDLFNMLLENVRKVFVPLKFLCLQCENGAAQGGWTSCTFGQRCAEKFQENSSTSGFTSSGCDCPNSDIYLCSYSSSNKNVHDGHCQNGQCIGSDSGPCSKASNGHSSANCKPCPHPLLRFLLDDFSESQSQSPSSPFRLPSSFARIDFSQTPPVILDASSDTFVTMGFSQGNLSPTAKKGFNLYAVLEVFCESGFYPLTRLLKFLARISLHPPETLGELFAFFKQFVSSNVFTSKFADYGTGEPGSYDGKNLKNAVEWLYKVKNSHSGSSHSPANLFSLSECHANRASKASCGPYLYPLTHNVAGVFTPELCSMYLSWICYLAKDFKTMFKDFHQKASEKFSSCCKSSCKKIVECPCAHPFLYSYGFTFWSPATLSGSDKKSCKDFIAQLDSVLASGSPLDLLIKQIEKFLWSIRLPFFLFVLAFWAFVISY
ncbi:variant erythrocyte surface antigen-1 family protein, partial [Babesia divergens]